ncbi:basic phospholipase A2 caudoxin-like [Engystomops pustulosus]|uniref:basic phospholipase A2 caudoxin-like n=1 Tax=Engystomops pustulosus TaxID=76066 RepID=UPI003AFB55B9
MASSLLTLLGTCLVMVIGAQAAILKFGDMISYMTERSAVSFLVYGCHCGLGGKGFPVDDIDWCCHAHDCCYDTLERMGCSPKMKNYHFIRIFGTIICDDKDLNGCARKTCECDRTASFCLHKFNSTFSKSKSFNVFRINCRGSKPPCQS